MKTALIAPKKPDLSAITQLIAFLLILLLLSLSAHSQNLLPIKPAQRLITISEDAARAALKARIDAESFAFELAKTDSIVQIQKRYIVNLEVNFEFQKKEINRLKTKLFIQKIKTAALVITSVFIAAKLYTIF